MRRGLVTVAVIAVLPVVALAGWDFFKPGRQVPQLADQASRATSILVEKQLRRLTLLRGDKVIKIYPAFAEFYGREEAIEQVVSYFRHAAQGLEEKKQILYLLGPVGGGKSSIAEWLKQLMEHVPFYALKDSPVNESPARVRF